MRENIIKELWWSSHRFQKGWWQKLAKIRLKEFEKQLYESCLADQASDSEKSKTKVKKIEFDLPEIHFFAEVWNFWQALFFSSTIFTTIGM